MRSSMAVPVKQASTQPSYVIHIGIISSSHHGLAGTPQMQQTAVTVRPSSPSLQPTITCKCKQFLHRIRRQSNTERRRRIAGPRRPPAMSTIDRSMHAGPGFFYRPVTPNRWPPVPVYRSGLPITGL
jgi:hypothetical protein